MPMKKMKLKSNGETRRKKKRSATEIREAMKRNRKNRAKNKAHNKAYYRKNRNEILKRARKRAERKARGDVRVTRLRKTVGNPE